VAKSINFPKVWKTLNILAYEQPISLTDLAQRLQMNEKATMRLLDHISLAGVPDFMPDRLLSFDQFRLEEGLVYCFIDLGIFDYFKNSKVQRLYEEHLIQNFLEHNKADQITIKYADRDGKVTDRAISKWHFYTENQRQYIDAYCHLRQSERTFLLPRIKKIEVRAA
jgi:predicted DNA-binding transcriptional regulator YafY